MCYHTCSDVMHASHGMRMQARRLPYVYMACQKLLMDMPFAPAKQYLWKITASHFSTLNMKIANQNICSTSVQAVGINRAVGMEMFQLQV